MLFLFGISRNHRDKVGKDGMTRSSEIDMSDKKGCKYDSHNVVKNGHNF